MTAPVLCVGPRTADRANIEAALTTAGLSVHWAEDQRQALDALSRGSFPLCLIDLAGNGEAVRTARAIRTGHPRALMIGLADATGDGDVTEAMRAGLFDVLPRPIGARELESLLANAREVIDRGLAPGPASPDSGVRRPMELSGVSPLIQRVNELIDNAAEGRCAVLIVAEDGIDAAPVAQEIHARSRRRDAPFVEVRCGGADPGGLERELFGGSQDSQDATIAPVGSASAAVRAIGGTLFLSTVGELSASLQARLARLARDGEMQVSGWQRPVRFDTRLIASCGPGIDREVEDGRFRPDLCRRLSTIRVELPPLRQRVDDIPLLAAALAATICASHGRPAIRFTQAALTLLAALPWRGNIEELRRLLEGVITSEPGDVITLECVLRHVRLDGSSVAAAPSGTLADARARFERDYIASVLQHHRWRMTDAARVLGIQRPNLYRKARQLGIPRGRPRSKP